MAACYLTIVSSKHLFAVKRWFSNWVEFEVGVTLTPTQS